MTETIDNNNLQNILIKHPDKIPVHVNRRYLFGNTFIKNNKFLVPKNFHFFDFIYVLRQRANLNPTQALFIANKDKVIPLTQTVGDVYDKLSDEDKILHLDVKVENVFGGDYNI